MLNAIEQIRLTEFKKAKKIALTIEQGFYQRPNRTSPYAGCNASGQPLVVADREEDLPNPDAYMDKDGKQYPVRKVNDDSTSLS